MHKLMTEDLRLMLLDLACGPKIWDNDRFQFLPSFLHDESVPLADYVIWIGHDLLKVGFYECFV